jgi:hypothetical protein
MDEEGGTSELGRDMNRKERKVYHEKAQEDSKVQYREGRT